MIEKSREVQSRAGCTTRRPVQEILDVVVEYFRSRVVSWGALAALEAELARRFCADGGGALEEALGASFLAFLSRNVRYLREQGIELVLGAAAAAPAARQLHLAAARDFFDKVSQWVLGFLFSRVAREHLVENTRQGAPEDIPPS